MLFGIYITNLVIDHLTEEIKPIHIRDPKKVQGNLKVDILKIMASLLIFEETTDIKDQNQNLIIIVHIIILITSMLQKAIDIGMKLIPNITHMKISSDLMKDMKDLIQIANVQDVFMKEE